MSDILLVGAGRMGLALAERWCAAGLGPRLHVVEPAPSDALRRLRRTGLILHAATATVPALTRPALVLAIKPQMMAAVAPGLAAHARRALVISIAAGVALDRLAMLLQGPRALVRAMPNLPAAVGAGITGAVAAPGLSTRDRARAERLLRAVGQVIWLPDETLIDAVTAVSGSGPAYVFLLAEALTQAGVAEGLDPQTAATLARATVSGAAALLAPPDADPAQLRAQVTSPGGTTAAALDVLDGVRGLRPLMRRAVAAARARARALGRA